MMLLVSMQQARLALLHRRISFDIGCTEVIDSKTPFQSSVYWAVRTIVRSNESSCSIVARGLTQRQTWNNGMIEQ